MGGSSGTAGIIYSNSASLPCNICRRVLKDPVNYGPFYLLGDIGCHYYCILLATTAVQRGEDEEGILGFLYEDIKKLIENNRKKKCVYCNVNGAATVCCHKSCRRFYHMPCGLQNGAQFLFYDTFQSFCITHRKKQIVPNGVLAKQRVLSVKLPRINPDKSIEYMKYNNENHTIQRKDDSQRDVCYICYDYIVYDIPHDLFWPSCCKQSCFFHRRCLSKFALSAGCHFFKCPLCNNKEDFEKAVLEFGIYIPTQDASWERENGAFSELLERPQTCTAKECKCPKSRDYNHGKWKMTFCQFCGSEASHIKCLGEKKFVCFRCMKNEENHIIRQNENIYTNESSFLKNQLVDLENSCVDILKLNISKNTEQELSLCSSILTNDISTNDQCNFFESKVECSSMEEQHSNILKNDNISNIIKLEFINVRQEFSLRCKNHKEENACNSKCNTNINNPCDFIVNSETNVPLLRTKKEPDSILKCPVGSIISSDNNNIRVSLNSHSTDEKKSSKITLHYKRNNKKAKHCNESSDKCNILHYFHPLSNNTKSNPLSTLSDINKKSKMSPKRKLKLKNLEKKHETFDITKYLIRKMDVVTDHENCN